MAMWIEATPSTYNEPPAVYLTVLSSSPTSSVTLLRQLPDGTSEPVRTPDGGPLTLYTVGANYVGTVVDTTAPFGVPLVYIANGVQSPVVRLNVLEPWLIHLGKPSLSVPLDLRSGSFTTRKRATSRGLFAVSGRERPMVITGGPRRARESEFTFTTTDLAYIDAVDDLTEDDSVLYLNVPATLGLGVKSCYVSCGDLVEARPSSVGGDALRAWTLPYVEVDAPLGGTAAAGDGGVPVDPNARTMADLAVELAALLGRTATMADAANAYGTMSGAAAGGA